MDGSAFGPQRDRCQPEQRPLESPPSPDAEWGLSAWQVVAAVLVILAASELIGVLSS